MSGFNIADYKIPIISGINDIPIPPNYNGNGKGNNGAYYVERLNKLADLFITYKDLPTVDYFTLNGSVDPVEVEVGDDISVPLLFEHSITNPVQNATIVASLYRGTDINNLTLASEDISSPLSYTPGTTKYNAETTLYWAIKYRIDDLFTIQTDIITTSWKKPYIAGSSASISISSNTAAGFTSSLRTLNQSAPINIGNLTELQYIYLFSPVQIKGIKIIDNDIKIPVVETQNAVVTVDPFITGFNDYYLYRSVEKTKGNFSFEIIP